MPPPVKRTLSYQLKEIIESRGLSGHAVGQLADVDPGIVCRFLSGKRSLTLTTLDKLAAALGLRLVEVGRRLGPAGRVKGGG